MKANRGLLKAGIALGGLLMLSPAMGVVGTFVGMMRAFGHLDSAGIADQKALSDDINVTLLATPTGLLLFPVGVAVFTVSIILWHHARHSSPPPLPQTAI